MIRAASFALIVLAAASPLAAAPAQCWIDQGALVVSAAFGEISGDFVVDLAAPVSRINSDQAQAHDILTPTTTAPLRLAGTRNIRQVQIANLGDITGKFDTTINGILGVDALAGYTLDINFTPCRFSLSKHRLRGGLPLTQLGGVPVIPAAISDGHIARSGLFRLRTTGLATQLAQAGPAGLRPLRLRALSMAGELYENLPATLMANPSDGIDGAIGTAMWGRGRLQLDLVDGRWKFTTTLLAGSTPRSRCAPPHPNLLRGRTCSHEGG